MMPLDEPFIGRFPPLLINFGEFLLIVYCYSFSSNKLRQESSDIVSLMSANNRPWWWPSFARGYGSSSTHPPNINSDNNPDSEVSPLLSPGDEPSGSRQSLPKGNDLPEIESASTDGQLTLSPKSIRMLEEADSRTRIMSILVGSLMLLLFGVGFILYPREAAFEIRSFDIDINNSTFQDGDQLYTNWISTVSVKNFNYYPININLLKVTAFLKKDHSHPVGYGRAAKLRFPARSLGYGQVNFRMPVYAPSTGKPSIIAECMVRDKVELLLKAEVDLSWTHWTGKSIPLDIYAAIDCKIPAI